MKHRGLRAGPLRVALYTENLHAALPAGLGAAATLDAGRAGAEGAAAAAEAALGDLADGVVRAGVELLLCQKLVAPVRRLRGNGWRSAWGQRAISPARWLPGRLSLPPTSERRTA